MFKWLQQKWQVSAKRFWIIFIAFGCTGLTAAYLTKAITGWLGMDEHTWWVYRLLLKLGMLLIGYQVLLLFYGALFGQWSFFWHFEKKLLQRLHILKMTPGKIAVKNTKHRLAIFASGAGSNAKKIIEYFKDHPTIQVDLVVCNKPGAGVLAIAEQHQIPTLIIERERFLRGDGYLPELKESGIHFIVLAGFLWKIPDALIAAYPGRIINIHPALLPKFGGKGMYGDHAHEAVIAAGEKESGITIHYVDGHYDHGDVILQVKCDVFENDTAQTLASRIHILEHEHYPPAIEKWVQQESSSTEANVKNLSSSH